VTISFDATNGDQIQSNTSNKPLQEFVETDDSSKEKDWWPLWVDQVTCLSHLALAFNSSVNYYIYYFKRRSLNAGILE